MSGVDPKAAEVAVVYRAGSRIGRLERTAHGAAFEFDETVFEANRDRPGGIAVHLPWNRRRTETAGVNLHSYFAGLLPEGIRLEALVRRVKTSQDDLFSLLVASGRDAIGDLAVLPEEEGPGPAAPALDVAAAAETDFAALFARTVGLDGDAADVPIPGVQEKVSAAQMTLPVRGQPSARKAFILKLDPPGHTGLVRNELFFMELARVAGLKTASVRLVTDRTGRDGLLVTRFDRSWDPKAKRLVEVHQEDGCQLLDRYPADKYRLSCAELARALDACAAPVPARLVLLRLIAFSYLIGNGDLHAKNVSVVEDSEAGGLVMSPAYDLLSTLPYGDRRMALKLDGKDDGLSRRMFVDFGARFGVAARATERMLDDVTESVIEGLSRLEEAGFTEKKLGFVRETALRRARELTAKRPAKNR